MVDVEVYQPKLRRRGLVPENKTHSTTVTINMPIKLLKEIDSIVNEGYFHSRSEMMRTAIMLLIVEIKRSDKNVKCART